MKRRVVVLIACASVMMSAAGSVIAKNTSDPSYCAPECVRNNVGHRKISAPEIDVSSGGSAVALLIAGMLIAAERRRSMLKLK